jgi:hypothetical protein
MSVAARTVIASGPFRDPAPHGWSAALPGPASAMPGGVSPSVGDRCDETPMPPNVLLQQACTHRPSAVSPEVQPCQPCQLSTQPPGVPSHFSWPARCFRSPDARQATTDRPPKGAEAARPGMCPTSTVSRSRRAARCGGRSTRCLVRSTPSSPRPIRPPSGSPAPRCPLSSRSTPRHGRSPTRTTSRAPTSPRASPVRRSSTSSTRRRSGAAGAPSARPTSRRSGRRSAASASPSTPRATPATTASRT